MILRGESGYFTCETVRASQSYCFNIYVKLFSLLIEFLCCTFTQHILLLVLASDANHANRFNGSFGSKCAWGEEKAKQSLEPRAKRLLVYRGNKNLLREKDFHIDNSNLIIVDSALLVRGLC